MLVICRDNSLFALKCLLPGALQPNCFSIETQIIYKWTVWKLSNSHGSWTIYASRPTYLVRLRLGTWMKITRQSIMFDAEFLESHNINFAVSFFCVCVIFATFIARYAYTCYVGCAMFLFRQLQRQIELTWASKALQAFEKLPHSTCPIELYYPVKKKNYRMRKKKSENLCVPHRSIIYVLQYTGARCLLYSL